MFELFSASICFLLVFAVGFGVGTVINYYLWNFVLSVFNTGYQLSWLQAVGVSIVIMVLRGIFLGRAGSSRDD